MKCFQAAALSTTDFLSRQDHSELGARLVYMDILIYMRVITIYMGSIWSLHRCDSHKSSQIWNVGLGATSHPPLKTGDKNTWALKMFSWISSHPSIHPSIYWGLGLFPHNMFFPCHDTFAVLLRCERLRLPLTSAGFFTLFFCSNATKMTSKRATTHPARGPPQVPRSTIKGFFFFSKLAPTVSLFWERRIRPLHAASAFPPLPFFPSPHQFKRPPPHCAGASCRNPSLLFNKQFVSDVSSADCDLIVCEMSLEVAVPPLPCILPVQTAGDAPAPPRKAHVWSADRCNRCVCVSVERSDAILKGLQLHRNGIIGHDGWLLPPLRLQSRGLGSGSPTRLQPSGKWWKI